MSDPDRPGDVLDRLDEPARLYVRPSGPARVATPRRFLVELPAGSAVVPLLADGVAFDVVSDAAPPDAQNATSPGSALDGLDLWIQAMSRLPCFAGRRFDAMNVEVGQAVAVAPDTTLTASTPLWVVSLDPLVTQPRLTGQPVECGFLPVFGDLGVSFAGQGDVRVVDSKTLMDEFGQQAVAEAGAAIGTVIADWFHKERHAGDMRAADLAAMDDARLEAARRELSTAAQADLVATSSDMADDPLLAAIAIIGHLEGFVVRRPPSEAVDSTLYRHLEDIALASNFRYREVALSGPWWREEGPPMLLFETGTGRPFAATWRKSSYQISDPDTGRQAPVTAETNVEPRGYMLYAGLPAVLSPFDLFRFALRGATGEARALLGSGLMAMLIGLLVPVATGVIVATALPDGRLDLLWEMALIVAAAAVGSAGFAAGRALATIRLSSRVDIRLQSALWDRLLRMPLHFFRAYTTGDLVQRVLAVDAIRQLLTGPVLSGLVSGIFAGMSFFLMLFYDVRLAIYGFVFAAITALVLFLLARYELKFLRQFRTAQGQVTARIVEILGGVAKLRFAAAEERGFARWAHEFTAQQHASWLSGRVHAMQGVLIAVLSPLGFLGVFLVAGYRAEPIDLAAFAAFNAAFGQFIGAVSVLAFALGTALQTIPLVERMAPILEQQPEVDETRGDPGRLRGRIDVRGLTFGYRQAEAPVLHDISFSVEPGQFVAIAGPSGAGKSTLLRLLLGFETPQAGAIYYDDHDLAQLDLRLVRRQIGTVLQNSGLVPGSLYENIAGASPLSDEEVMEAARQAGLADDIADFPMGLETFVAEDASSVSGGQRQRIMISRALVHKPPILYFDEATSSLDNRTQTIVSDNIENLNVTRIVIAHRLSTIRHADKILVIESGRLMEAGTYDDLMAARGAFYRLAERQLV